MEISPSRLEAFSDGVIAIIITIMVFDLKPDVFEEIGDITFAFIHLVPKFLSYLLSFIMLAIM
ncbi:MAG: DUF1211 domain-containing protein [Bacteroidota bacterium]|nr:DUF1211 domain-containing protein [Bacteroidota bacterium]